MAIRRMFSKRITESTKFIKMPVSSQNLYFHLGMKADDDGIVEAYPVMCVIGATEDDLKILVAKQFVTVLNEDYVAFINDWTENNTIRADRKVDSIYKDLLLQIIPDAEIKESKKIICQSNDGQMSDAYQPNDSIGKDRIGKDRIDKVSTGKDSVDYQLIADMYNNTCVSFPRLTKLSENRKKAIKARLKIYSVEDFQKLFEMAEGSSFLKGQNNRNWSATFDWLIKDTNMAKVLDGNYTDKEPIELSPEERQRRREEERRREEQEQREWEEAYHKRQEERAKLPYDPNMPFR